MLRFSQRLFSSVSVCNCRIYVVSCMDKSEYNIEVTPSNTLKLEIEILHQL